MDINTLHKICKKITTLLCPAEVRCFLFAEECEDNQHILGLPDPTVKGSSESSENKLPTVRPLKKLHHKFRTY